MDVALALGLTLTLVLDMSRAHAYCAIIEFSSKCNQAKFCTPSAFLTKSLAKDEHQDELKDSKLKALCGCCCSLAACNVSMHQMHRYKFTKAMNMRVGQRQRVRERDRGRHRLQQVEGAEMVA